MTPISKFELEFGRFKIRKSESLQSRRQASFPRSYFEFSRRRHPPFAFLARGCYFFCQPERERGEFYIFWALEFDSHVRQFRSRDNYRATPLSNWAKRPNGDGHTLSSSSSSSAQNKIRARLVICPAWAKKDQIDFVAKESEWSKDGFYYLVFRDIPSKNFISEMSVV